MKTLAISILALFLLSSCSLMAPSKVAYQTYVTKGQTMPLTSVTLVNGEELSLNDPSKRKLVILFATWCSDSQRALKALSTSNLLKDEDLQIVAIARENTVEQVIQFKAERNLTIPFVADVDRSIYSQFANAGIPRFIIVGKDNKIIDTVIAEGDNQLSLVHW